MLEHTAEVLRRHGKLSGMLPQWVKAKVTALDFIWANCAGGLATMLDVGIGDMAHMEAWDPFKRRALEYHGVDGCNAVLDRARERHPDLLFAFRAFSRLVQNCGPVADLVVALDVFYHIQDDALHEQLRQWVFEHAGRYVLLSHATDMRQTFELGLRPGDNGFNWFPRPVPIPEGWKVLHQADCTQGSAAQRLLVLGRTD